MQLVFLLVVEEPHIERTYGSNAKAVDPYSYRVLYDPKSGLFPGQKSSVFFLHFDKFLAGDFSLVGFCIYGILACAVLDRKLTVAQVVVWRLVHWIGLGYVLWSQSKRQAWTRHFTDRGRTLYEAFDNWKHVYNVSLTMNVLVFVGCALRHIDYLHSWHDLLVPQNAAYVALGVVLIALNVWSSSSTFSAVGDFGYFYGDFFIPTEQYQHSLVYTGIYRFLNNPDCVTGYAGFYGLALIAQSWTIFTLALISQVLNIMFLNLVEIPHMHRLYQRQLRKDGALSRVLKEKIRKSIPRDVDAALERKMRVEARKIKLTAMKEVYQIYKRMSLIKDQLTDKLKGDESPRVASPDHTVSKSRRSTQSTATATAARARQSTTISCPETVQLGEDITVAYSTTADHSDTDWIGLYEIDVPSMPGHSSGRWIYVPVGPKGNLRFSFNLLPKTSGVYEIRYFVNNTFTEVASQPFQVVDPDSDVDNDGRNTPVNSPPPVASKREKTT